MVRIRFQEIYQEIKLKSLLNYSTILDEKLTSFPALDASAPTQESKFKLLIANTQGKKEMQKIRTKKRRKTGQQFVGLNPSAYWMDVSDKASYYIQ